MDTTIFVLFLLLLMVLHKPTSMLLCTACLCPFHGLRYSMSGRLTIDITILLFWTTLIVSRCVFFFSLVKM